MRCVPPPLFPACFPPLEKGFSAPFHAHDFNLKISLCQRALGMYTSGKNRTLMQTRRGVHFYVSLTRRRVCVAAERHFRGSEIYFLLTEIGFVAAGILGVFPACTSRRGYMYISAARNSLILNTTKDGVRTRCISHLFTKQR